jgi:hypothetical protein
MTQQLRLSTAVFLAATLIAGTAANVLAQARDPFVGTWVLNPDKSKFNPTIYSRSTMTIEAIGARRKTVVDTELDGGAKVHYEFTATYDGKDVPVQLTTADSVTLRRIDARTIERVHKQKGEVNAIFTSRLSNDEKTMTVTQKGTNPAGKPIDNVLVFERR